MKVNRYKLKDGTTKENLIAKGFRQGGSWVSKDAVMDKFYLLTDSIELWIAFPEDLSKWNDFNYVVVIDDDFGQLYTPFYTCLNDENFGFEFVNEVVSKYNEVMGSLLFLEEIEEE